METTDSSWNPEWSISAEDSVRYVQCMEEVKNRLVAAWSMFGNNTHTTPFRATNIEFACLQIRKILELIALASLSANKEEYSKQHANFSKHWRAKAILQAVEKVNPNFYPTPTREVGDPSGQIRDIELLTEGFLTKQEFSTVYDLCSQTLHASNPYGEQINYPFFEKEIPVWLEKIKKLLNTHIVMLLNKRESLWIILRSQDDGKVKGTIFKKIEDPTPEKIAAAEKMRESYQAKQKK
jgi:hypothetical protein